MAALCLRICNLSLRSTQAPLQLLVMYGSSLQLACDYRFKCDLFTLNYMEKNIKKFPLADAASAVERLSGVL